MGKYHRILEPGLNVLIPLLDKIKYVQRLKEMAIDIPQQTAITIGWFGHFKSLTSHEQQNVYFTSLQTT